MMNLEEHAELLRKRAKKLLDIDVDEISLVTSPAVRKSFYIKKGSEKMKGFDEILSLAGEFLSEDISKAKGINPRELMQAVKSVIDFKDDLPDKMKDAIGVILRWAGSSIEKSEDPYPSIPIMMPASTIENMLDEDDEDIDE